MHKISLSKIAQASLLLTSITMVSTSAMAAKAKHHYKGEMIEETTVVATPVTTQMAPTLKGGAYAGVGLGYDSFRVRQTGYATTSAASTVNFSPALTARSFSGNFVVGYGQYMSNLYLGAEAKLKMSNARASFNLATDSNYTSKVVARNSYGIDFTPGYKLSDSSLVFAKVGYVRTNFQTSESINVTGDVYSTSPDNWQNGFEYGLGMENAITDQISLKSDFTYTSYTKFQSTRGTNYRPSNTQFNLGVVYHFA